MNKNTRNILIGLGVVAIIGLVIYFSMSGSGSGSDTPSPSPGGDTPPSLAKGNACRKQCGFKDGMSGSVLNDYKQCYKKCTGN